MPAFDVSERDWFQIPSPVGNPRGADDVPYPMVPRLRRLLGSVAIIYLLVTLFGGAVLCYIALHPPRRALDYQITAREVAQRGPAVRIENATVIAAGGVQLRGWSIHPQDYNGNAVIILHGVADNRLGAAGFAADFIPEGYAVLLPDARAHGESGGAFASYGILEADDVRRWIDWLETKEAPHCIYLLGESMGAAIAIQATAADPRICATVAESPFANFREVAYERIGQMSGTGPWLGKTIGRPMIEFAFLLARLRTGVWLTNASPLRAIQATRTPILLIHGAADTHISPAESEELYRAGRDHAQLWIAPGAEHCGASAVAPNEFHRRVLGWFQAHPNATAATATK